MKKILSAALFLFCAALNAQPTGLLTDLMPNTGRVTAQGQTALVRSTNPTFSWIVPNAGQGTVQTAYRILLATSPSLLEEGKADVWDSGKVKSSQSTAVRCQSSLEPGNTYYWKVRVWTNPGSHNRYSAVQQFTTTEPDGLFSFRPLVKEREKAQDVREVESNLYFADFGKDAFAQACISLTCSEDATILVRLGESVADGRINRNPGATIRYAEYLIPVTTGHHDYQIELRRDPRNAKPHTGSSVYESPVLMPDYIGEVYPFRYVEVEYESGAVQLDSISRDFVHHPFNYESSSFVCSDPVLNEVWELCKYSILATSFTGIYVDGDRERIPYEGDAVINQLAHYCTDREFSMARRSVDFLINCATWPTEWILDCVIMAWNEYLYTGDASLISKYYNDLKAKTLISMRDENGLISPATYNQTPEFLKSIHIGEPIRDIVDWPRNGAFGIGKEEAGEADGYVLTSYNTVPNAYHYGALTYMARIADAIGYQEDADEFRQMAEKTKASVNELFLDKDKGYYRDGLASEVQHWAQHASSYPLAFGLVPEDYLPSVREHIRSRGMACSVYGAQFLLDALYDGFEADYALSLMNSTSERSWYNMLRAGSTITLESWDPRFKSNLDWNHAWGAAPANIIPRKLMGIEPLEPGFSKIRIRPQPGTMNWAAIQMPTIKGDVVCAFEHKNGYELDIEIPANTTAEIWYLCPEGTSVKVNGVKTTAERRGDFLVIEKGSGKYLIGKF